MSAVTQLLIRLKNIPCILMIVIQFNLLFSQSNEAKFDSISLEIISSSIINGPAFFEATRDSGWNHAMLSNYPSGIKNIPLGEGCWIIERYFLSNDHGFKVFWDQNTQKGLVLTYGRYAEKVCPKNIEQMLKEQRTFFDSFSEDSLQFFLLDLIFSPFVHVYKWENGKYERLERRFCEREIKKTISESYTAKIEGKILCYAEENWQDANGRYGGLIPSFLGVKQNRGRLLLWKGKRWRKWQFFYPGANVGFQFKYKFKDYFPYYLL